jgi:hypothetical protein
MDSIRAFDCDCKQYIQAVKNVLNSLDNSNEVKICNALKSIRLLRQCVDNSFMVASNALQGMAVEAKRAINEAESTANAALAACRPGDPAVMPETPKQAGSGSSDGGRGGTSSLAVSDDDKGGPNPKRDGGRGGGGGSYIEARIVRHSTTTNTNTTPHQNHHQHHAPFWPHGLRATKCYQSMKILFQCTSSLEPT